MKLRVTVFVDLIELDHPEQPGPQRVMHFVEEQDYVASDYETFHNTVNTRFDYVLTYLKRWTTRA